MPLDKKTLLILTGVAALSQAFEHIKGKSLI